MCYSHHVYMHSYNYANIASVLTFEWVFSEVFVNSVEDGSKRFIFWILVALDIIRVEPLRQGICICKVSTRSMGVTISLAVPQPINTSQSKQL